MLIGSIILAGGTSGRMQTPKASLAWRDASLLFDRVEAMMACSYPVVVVMRDAGQELPPLNTECEFTTDTIRGEGPLVAIHAGLAHVHGRCDAAAVLGCDFPFFDRLTVHWLSERLLDHAGVVPMDGDTPQPLCGMYRTSLLPKIRDLMDKGKRAAQAVLELPGVVTIDSKLVEAFDPKRRFLFDIDTPEDYERAKSWMS